MRKEKVDDVVVASLCCPHRWCGYGFAALCVHVGSGVEEEFAHGVLVIDCSPLAAVRVSLATWTDLLHLRGGEEVKEEEGANKRVAE